MTNAEMIAEANRQSILAEYRTMGTITAEALQGKSLTLTATEIVAQEEFIPTFANAILVANMQDRKAGFLCKDGEYTVKLITPYNSDTYPNIPTLYPSMWAFQWSKDPNKAKTFIALSTSPYMIDECCLNNEGVAKKSLIDNNVWSPDANPEYWADA